MPAPPSQGEWQKEMLFITSEEGCCRRHSNSSNNLNNWSREKWAAIDPGWKRRLADKATEKRC